MRHRNPKEQARREAKVRIERGHEAPRRQAEDLLVEGLKTGVYDWLVVASAKRERELDSSVGKLETTRKDDVHRALRREIGEGAVCWKSLVGRELEECL